MAEDTTGAGNTAAPQHGDRDRVAMLSLNADGTPDQRNPELIGDRESALAATREQFRQQAVSAADAVKRTGTADTGVEVVGQDPMIEELQAAHESAAKDAESAAERTVAALYRDDAVETAAPKVARTRDGKQK